MLKYVPVVMMMHENKKLAALGLAGVLAALMIIASVIMMPLRTLPKVLLGVSVGSDELLKLEGPEGVAYESWPIKGQPPCILNVTIYEFTKPLGPGSEADLMITLTSKLNVSEVFHVEAKITNMAEVSEQFREEIGFPGGISFIDGGTEWTWSGDVETNGSKTFNSRMKALGVGIARLMVAVTTRFKETVPGSGMYFRINIWVDILFTILPDNILVYSSYPKPEPFLFLENIEIFDWPLNRGVGTEFNASVRLSGDNTTNVTLKLIVQEGIVPIDGQTIWTGNISSISEVSLSARLRFVKVGSWFIYAYVEKDGILFASPSAFEFIVSENDIIAYKMT